MANRDLNEIPTPLLDAVLSEELGAIHPFTPSFFIFANEMPKWSDFAPSRDLARGGVVGHDASLDETDDDMPDLVDGDILD